MTICRVITCFRKGVNSMDSILDEIKDIYNLYIVLLVIATGLFTFFVDSNQLRQDNLYKDSTIARVIGLVYMIAGPLVYIIVRII